MSSLQGEQWPTPGQAKLLRESMVRLIPACESISASFYSGLFEMDPSLRPLFPEDMQAQQDKLILMLAAAIDMLDDQASFETSCAALGYRHLAYGALPSHYPIVAQLTVEELCKAANPPLTEEERECWTMLLQLINNAMLRGADQTADAPIQGRPESH